ncbi:hypothetical protein EDB89DRAFT_1903770 [Lactarius sanguifluus]|nr:hypothetical protein EDB89DRAFT_1903770 [Lactarius sanguifluus]
MSVAATPGTYLVELFPWMLYIPETLVLVLVVFLTQSFGAALGSERPSLSATLSQNSDRNQLSNQLARGGIICQWRGNDVHNDALYRGVSKLSWTLLASGRARLHLQTSWAIRTYKQWSKSFFDDVLLLRSLSHTQQRKTIGTMRMPSSKKLTPA